MTDVGWIGIDLDGTLAHYEPGDIHRFGVEYIGPPVEPMVMLVRAWLSLGKDVRLFTARAANPDPECFEAMRQWCKKWLGREIPITNVKDFHMIALWDDRCVQIKTNTGERVGNHPIAELPIDVLQYQSEKRDPRASDTWLDQLCEVAEVAAARISKLEKRIENLEALIEDDEDHECEECELPSKPCCDVPFEECPHGKGFTTYIVGGKIVSEEEAREFGEVSEFSESQQFSSLPVPTPPREG